ncbi:MAG: hypothetical protein ACREFK_05765 [Stellaceae bacterium]
MSDLRLLYGPRTPKKFHWGARGWGLIATLMLGALAGCSIGGPERASNIQNINAASDDIAAITMTQSPQMRANDPNEINTLPGNYQLITNRDQARQ